MVLESSFVVRFDLGPLLIYLFTLIPLAVHVILEAVGTFYFWVQKPFVFCSSGGWVALVCEHGCTYAVKFILRGESVRDYSDMLLSMKYMPNVVCADLAPRLAKHVNRRCPETLPFQPNDGSFLEPTEDNIKAAKAGTARVKLPWLDEKKMPPDCNAHPITGSNEHYCCLDRLHESNWKADEHRVRSVKLVQQLRGSFNTQASEQFNAEMGKNNYFLNMMSPTTQVFVFRLLVELRNSKKNKSRMMQVQREFPGQDLNFDKFGRLVYGQQQMPLSFDTSDTDSASEAEPSSPNDNAFQFNLEENVKIQQSVNIEHTYSEKMQKEDTGPSKPVEQVPRDGSDQNQPTMEEMESTEDQDTLIDVDVKFAAKNVSRNASSGKKRKKKKLVRSRHLSAKSKSSKEMKRKHLLDESEKSPKRGGEKRNSEKGISLNYQTLII